MRCGRIDEDLEFFKKCVAESLSFSELGRKMGYKGSGSLHKFLQDQITKHRLDNSHFVRYVSRGKTVFDSECVLRSRSSRIKKDCLVFRNGFTRSVNSGSIIKRLVFDFGWEYSCSICRLSNWENSPLRLQLDHMDGDPSNNLLSNLRLICPNCHSQTRTFSRGNSKKVDESSSAWWKRLSLEGVSLEQAEFWRRATHKNPVQEDYPTIKYRPRVPPVFCVCGKKVLRDSKFCRSCYKENHVLKFEISKEELEKLVWEIPTEQIAKMFGVSDKAIEKRCKKLGVSKPPRGYWAKKKYGKI